MLSLGEMVAVMPICKHIFHEKCFKQHIATNSYACPYCGVSAEIKN